MSRQTPGIYCPVTTQSSPDHRQTRLLSTRRSRSNSCPHAPFIKVKLVNGPTLPNQFRAQSTMQMKYLHSPCLDKPFLRFLLSGMLALFSVASGSVSASGQTPAPAWRGTLQDEAAHPIVQAKVGLDADDEHKTTTTTSDGAFVFDSLLPKTYSLSVEVNGRVYRSPAAISISAQAAGVILT